MSQSGYTPIQLYRTTTASATPSAGNLSDGELAINLTDEKLFFKNASGVVKVIASTAGGSSVVSYPQNIQSSNYTLVLTDAGKQIYSANTGAQVITVPANASVAFPIGTVITIVNMGTSSIRLSVSGVSIYPNGSRTAISVPVVSSGVSMQLVKTDTDSWNATFGSVIEGSSISYLVVAGGGGGGSSNTGAAGGGAGGMRTGTVSYAAGTYTVTVGAGGTGGATSTNANGANGSDSVFSTITSLGGGGGAGPASTFGLSGGSGSGGTWQSYAGGAGTAGQGNNGGRGSDGYNYGGGGGGGAGAAGGLSTGGFGGNGGAGLASSITGTSVVYAGGGGGSAITPGAGGLGGGGAGSPYNSATGNGTAGTANTGGGGGASGGNVWGAGGNGGSGVVIIASAVAANSTTGSPTVTIANGITIYTFTSSGTITW